MKRLRITWERIGRNHSVPDFVHDFEPGDEQSENGLCFLVDEHIGRYLMSRHFEWGLDLEDGPILIDGGRFGKGYARFTDTPALDTDQQP